MDGNEHREGFPPAPQGATPPHPTSASADPQPAGGPGGVRALTDADVERALQIQPAIAAPFGWEERVMSAVEDQPDVPDVRRAFTEGPRGWRVPPVPTKHWHVRRWACATCTLVTTIRGDGRCAMFDFGTDARCGGELVEQDIAPPEDEQLELGGES